jgi:hypothetical protein
LALDPLDEYPPRRRSGRGGRLRPWRKGESGNPRGRPPKLRDLTDFELASDVIEPRAVGLSLAGWIRLRRAELRREREIAWKLRRAARDFHRKPPA